MHKERREALLKERKNILTEYATMTLEELGKKYGVSKQAIRLYIRKHRRDIIAYNNEHKEKSESVE